MLVFRLADCKPFVIEPGAWLDLTGGARALLFPSIASFLILVAVKDPLIPTNIRVGFDCFPPWTCWFVKYNLYKSSCSSKSHKNWNLSINLNASTADLLGLQNLSWPAFIEEYDAELFTHHLTFVSGIYFMSLKAFIINLDSFILCYCLVPVSKSGLSQSSLFWAAGGGIT